MKLKFIEQQYQTDAVNAIVDIFEGSEVKDSLFTIDTSADLPNKDLGLEGEGITYVLGHANKLTLDDFELLNNVRTIQERNKIYKSTKLENRNFTVEMETGTGKTYVYTKTILELNKKYGFTKFIIVVPSIAIKEGVNKSFEITKEHFMQKYNNISYKHFIYDSSKLDDIRSFAVNTNIEVMIINIQAFNKSFTENSSANIIHRDSDRLSGNKPIDLISGTNPIVIIDEPQSVDNTAKAKEAINTLNPMVILRYSATHKEQFNLMYRLSPVDAFQRKLVKSIEVSSIIGAETTEKGFVKLLKVIEGSPNTAKLEIYSKKKDGSKEIKTITVKTGIDLWDASKELDDYKDQNYIVEDIDATEGSENILFTNGETLNLGDTVGAINEEALKRAQISDTIKHHLRKEIKHVKNGIKVLSLIFIDKVSNYREYDTQGNPIKGKYALWFEEEYERLINTTYRNYKEVLPNYYRHQASDLHDGYFSIDKKNRVKDTSGDSNDDVDTYTKIMKDKERLLSLDDNLRFIFSHSALKEGWDNPNVFQVCTLVETQDTMTKRQKIGRGLRLCVNNDGDRIFDSKTNVLTVIANESYKEFSESLQKEFEKEAGYKFGVVDQVSFVDLTYVDDKDIERVLSQKDSTTLYKNLVEVGYINGTTNKATTKFYKDVSENIFEVADEFSELKEKIIDKIVELSKEVPIVDANNKVKVHFKNDHNLPEAFIELWSKINKKTTYSIQMDINNFVRACVNDLIEKFTRNPIKKLKVETENVRLAITKKGVEIDGSVARTTVGNVQDFEKTRKPDVIRRIQEASGITRKTIVKILIGVNKIEYFNNNPEVFIKEVLMTINYNKKKFMADSGLVYTQTGEEYDLSLIFNDDELFAYVGKNAFELDSEKYIYDFVIYDSDTEKKFAEDAEYDDDVLMYAKLPVSFKIKTPYGNYSPDWMVVMRSDEGNKLYFIAETKGTIYREQLRGTEDAKINSAIKHFEALREDVTFKQVNSLDGLKS